MVSAPEVEVELANIVIGGACCCHDIIDEPNDGDCDLDCIDNGLPVNYNQPVKVTLLGGGIYRTAGGSSPFNGDCAFSPSPSNPCKTLCPAHETHLTGTGCDMPTGTGQDPCACADYGNAFSIIDFGLTSGSGVLQPLPEQPCENMYEYQGLVHISHPVHEIKYEPVLRPGIGNVCQVEYSFCSGGFPNQLISYDATVMVTVGDVDVYWSLEMFPIDASPHMDAIIIYGGGVHLAGFCKGMTEFWNAPLANPCAHMIRDLQCSLGDTFENLNGQRFTAPFPPFAGGCSGSDSNYSLFGRVMPPQLPPPFYYFNHQGCGECYLLSNDCQKVNDFSGGAITIGF